MGEEPMKARIAGEHNKVMKLIYAAFWPDAFNETYEKGMNEFEKIMFIIPVKKFGIVVKPWQSACWSLAPNYVQVPSSAVAISAAWHTWTARRQVMFQARWDYVL